MLKDAFFACGCRPASMGFCPTPVWSSMKIQLPVIIGISLLVAAIAWAMPFWAPMVWSYWAAAIWCAISVAAVAVHGKRALWVLLGAPLALQHAAFAAFIFMAWR
jgi:hypothetical protein